MQPPASSVEGARRRGRTLATLIFGLVITAITACWSIEIMIQTWGHPRTRTAGDCRVELRKLLQTVHDARHAAAGNPHGETETLKIYRSALGETWKTRHDLAAFCQGDELALQTLAEVSALGYAEEHALRYEAAGVGPLRQRVQVLQTKLFGPSSPHSVP